MNDNNDQHCETNKTTEKKITQMNEHQGEKKRNLYDECKNIQYIRETLVKCSI